MANYNPIELPDEIWIIIFTNLCTEDIFQNVILVCKRFHILCMDSTSVLIKNMSMSRRGSTSRNFDFASQDNEYKLLKSSKQLNSLSVSNRTDVEYLLYLALQHSPNLRHMELKNCDLSNDCRATIVVKGQSLQHISLIKCKNDFSSDDVCSAAKTISMEMFRISAFQEFDLGEFLISLAYHCINLNSLHLESLASEESIITFLKTKRENLKILNFAEYIQGYQWFHHLQYCENLQELTIINGENIDHCAMEAISKLSQLKNLTLNSVHNVLDQDFISLISNLNNLKHLDLSCCNINDEVLKVVSINCLNLKVLCINWCENICDLCSLCFMPKYSTTLEKLSLRGLNKIESSSSISRIIESLPNLDYLDLFDGPKTNDSCLKRLLMNNAKLKIIDNYGRAVTKSEN